MWQRPYIARVEFVAPMDTIILYKMIKTDFITSGMSLITP